MPVACRVAAVGSTSDSARTRRGADAAAPRRARASSSSSRVLQAPHAGQRPCHFGCAAPHSRQTKRVVGCADIGGATVALAPDGTAYDQGVSLRRLRRLPGALIAAACAVVWASLALAAAYTLPVYEGQACSSSGGCESTGATLVDVNGARAAALLALPLAASLLVAWLLQRRLAGGRAWTLQAAFTLAVATGALGLSSALAPAVLPVAVLLAVGAALVASQPAPR